MKKPIVTICFLFFITCSYGQTTTISSMVDSLKYLRADTLDWKADLYWRIIAQGDKAIPFLIDKLTDTTMTRVRFHCKQGRLNVAEIAQFALTQIAYFPAFLVTQIQFDLIEIDGTGQGCWSFYDFFFMNSNKQRYKESMQAWYNKEKPRYKAVRIPGKEQNECQIKYGIDTYYQWKE